MAPEVTALPVAFFPNSGWIFHHLQSNLSEMKQRRMHKTLACVHRLLDYGLQAKSNPHVSLNKVVWEHSYAHWFT